MIRPWNAKRLCHLFSLLRKLQLRQTSATTHTTWAALIHRWMPSRKVNGSVRNALRSQVVRSELSWKSRQLQLGRNVEESGKAQARKITKMSL